MNKAIITIVSVVFVMSICNVQGAIDWDFYEDGTIDPGDEYWNVGVYDTPPDHTTVDMLGGLVDSISAHNESIVNLSGGSVSTLSAFDSCTINAFGGSVYTLWAYDTGTVNVWGDADVVVLDTRETGTVNIIGGTVDRAGTLDFGTINLSGGLVLDGLWAGDSGIINIYGFDLAKEISGGGYGYGFVSGKWTNGTMFNIDFGWSPTYSRVVLHEIPEPTTLVIVMAGVLFLRRLRK